MGDQTTAQGDHSVAVGRHVINSIINTGDHNRFFIGDYERLRDAYIEPWSVFERVDLDHFVGREWLLAEVDAFLRDYDRGYFILEAKAGLGKTTFLAWLTQKRGYIHHFIELAPGLDGVGRGLKNLAAQLVLVYHLSACEAEGVLPGAAVRPDYLLRLLKQAADQRPDGEKIVLVVDALDEAGTPERQNVLGLPQILPEGVFIIVSQKPVQVTLQVDTATTPRRTFHLAADSDENQDDMRRFLDQATSWPGIAQALQESGYTSEQFITTLLEKSRGVWIYLHYVIHEIERGERSPLDLDTLPDGMTQYYASYWQRWRDEDEDKWYGIYLPLLTTLAAAQEPITAQCMAEWTDMKMSVQRLRRLLNEHWRPFLAVTGKDQQARYRFYHATLRDFFQGRVERQRLTTAQEALVDELAPWTQEAHHRVADRYLTAWGGLRDGLPRFEKAAQREIDEGYGLRHLGVHLQASGRVQELHRLLALETSKQRNAWYKAKDAIGDAAGYMADVMRAWRLAEEAYVPTDNTHAGESIGLQIRYALITASLNSLAGNIPSGLMAALVQQGIWTPSQGLAYAQHVPESLQRASAVAALAPHLPQPLLQEALTAAWAIELEDDRVQALTGLAPHLPEALLQEALAAARAIKDEYWRAEALVGLAAHLSEALKQEVLHEALTATRAIEHEWDRAARLAAIASHLPEPLKQEVVQEALVTAQATGEEKYRALALVDLAPHLPDRLLAEALVATGSISEEWQLAMALAALGPHLPRSLLKKAWAAARAIGDEMSRAEALAGLAPHLPELLLEEALATACAIEDEYCWVEALAGIAPHLPEPPLREVLAHAREIWINSLRARLLTALVPHLPQSLKGEVTQEALTAARATHYRRSQARTLTALAPHLSEPLKQEVMEEALAATRAVGDERYQAESLAALSPGLPEPLKQEVVQEGLVAARAIEDEGDRVKAVAALAPHMPEAVKREALQEARSTRYAWYRAEALAALAPHLSEPLKQEVVEEALAAARAIRDEEGRMKALATLAAHLPEPLKQEVVQEALTPATAITDERCQAEALAALAPHLPQPLLQEALQAAREIGDEEYRAMVLAGLAPRLPQALLEEALQAAREIGDEEYQAMALAGLAPRLRQPLLKQALAAAREIGYEDHRAKALLILVPHLVQSLRLEVMQEALVAAREIHHKEDRAKALATLTPHLAELTLARLYPLWLETVHLLASRTRHDLLADISVLEPVIAALGGQEGVAETAHAIVDVGRWWP